MAKFVYYNRNPDGEKQNDCVTRAISLGCDLPYSRVRQMLHHTAKLLNCERLCVMCYKFLIEDVLKCKRVNCDGMYPAEFADLNPHGVYLLRMNGHICCLMHNTIFDIFDSRYMDFLTDAWKII
jgi:hypothetical protein